MTTYLKIRTSTIGKDFDGFHLKISSIDQLC
jgi:hypothetical protein